MTTPALLAAASPPVESFTVNAFGDRYLYRVNRESFNKLGAAAVFQAYFGDRLFAENTLHIVIGTDSGLLLQHVADRGGASGSRYLFVELPEVLDQLGADDRAGLGDKGLCVAPEQWIAQARSFKINEYFYINSVALWQSLAARDANLPDYAELVWEIDAELAHLQWLAQAELGNETFTDCQLANLAENLEPATRLKGVFRGRTALLLAGGPSLDAILPWTFEHRERIVVMAVSRVSRRLQQVGLIPDLVFSVDPTELSFDVSKEMLEFGDEVALIHAFHMTPLLLGQWRGPSFYLGDLLPWKSPRNPASLPNSGPTVTNTALSVGQALGFHRIILAGVDLCFSRSGHTHAEGSNERQAGPRFDLTGLQVETYGGWLADTSPDFAHARFNLEIQARQLAQLGCELINPSPDSARVAQVRHCPLADIDLPEEPIDARTILHRHPSTATARRQHVSSLLREIRRGIHSARAIRALAVEALDHNLGIYRSATGDRSRRSKILLDRVERRLNTRHRLFAKLTKRLGIRDFLKVTRPFDDEEMDSDSAQRLGTVYYEAYRDGSERLLKLLESAEQRLCSRLEEEAERPDLAGLCGQWQRDRQFGRARLWLERHPGQAPAARELGDLGALHQAYREVLLATDSKHLRRARQHSSLAAAQQRARILLRNRQGDKLRDLLESLADHPDSGRGPLTRHLVSAYLAEAEGDHDRALQELHPIIEAGPSPLLEDALMRVFLVSVEVEQPDNAAFALQCLAQLSPLYQPQHAEMLRLLGRPLDAADAYSAFLQRFPDDAYVHLRLARLYLDIGAVDSCRLLLTHILEKWPGNTTAAELSHMLDRPVASG